jgi:hypothetical protein
MFEVWAKIIPITFTFGLVSPSFDWVIVYTRFFERGEGQPHDRAVSEGSPPGHSDRPHVFDSEPQLLDRLVGVPGRGQLISVGLQIIVGEGCIFCT